MDLFNSFHSLQFFHKYSDNPLFYLGMIFIASLLGSTHCVSMCGPVAFIAQKKRGGLYYYQAGRLFSYLSVGSLLGIFGSVVFEKFLYHPIFSLLFICILLFSLGMLIFKLLDISFYNIHFIEKTFSAAGIYLFEKISRFFNVFSNSPFFLGCITSILPCGWLGFFYLLSFSQKDPFLGALTLVLFWAGSLPVFILLSKFSQNFFAHIGIRSKKIAALILGVVVLSLSLRLFLHSV